MSLISMYKDMFKSLKKSASKTGEGKNMSAYKYGDMPVHIQRNENYIKKLDAFEELLEADNQSEEYYEKLSEIFEIMNNYSSDLKDYIINDQ